MKEIIFATTNKYKVKMFKDIALESIEKLGFRIKFQEIPDIAEIQGSCLEVIIDKCLRAYDFLKLPVIVDDESLLCDGLNGFPGPYLKDFEAHLLASGIYNVINNSSSKICYPQVFYGITFDGKLVNTFNGKMKATIIEPRKGKENSKNYFEVMYSEEQKMRFSDLDDDDGMAEGKYDMRKEALDKLLTFLSNYK
jgi:XTP/dITP diphosphohydrolase